MVSYDIDEGAVDGAYKMQHQGEKFSLGGATKRVNFQGKDT